MDRLQLTGQNPDRVFNFRSDRVHAEHLLFYGVKRPNLKLKTRPQRVLGYLPEAKTYLLSSLVDQSTLNVKTEGLNPAPGTGKGRKG